MRERRHKQACAAARFKQFTLTGLSTLTCETRERSTGSFCHQESVCHHTELKRLLFTHRVRAPCRLAAQLARTEEAAKRALVRSDQGAKGSTAQQLLDAQRQIQQLQAENSELSSKLARCVCYHVTQLES
jgi:hypothetical protein